MHNRSKTPWLDWLDWLDSPPRRCIGHYFSERADNVVHSDTTCLFFSLFALFHAGQTQHRGLTGCSTHSTVPNKVLR